MIKFKEAFKEVILKQLECTQPLKNKNFQVKKSQCKSLILSEIEKIEDDMLPFGYYNDGITDPEEAEENNKWSGGKDNWLIMDKKDYLEKFYKAKNWW